MVKPILFVEIKQTAASRETRKPVNYFPQIALDNKENIDTAVDIPPPILQDQQLRQQNFQRKIIISYF